MPSEKELNVNLLDKLDLLERLEMADSEGGYEKLKQQLAFEKKCIERKLELFRLCIFFICILKCQLLFLGLSSMNWIVYIQPCSKSL